MIIYIHGFNSSGQSGKAHELSEIFVDEQVLAPDLPWQPKLAIEMLEALIQSYDDESLLLVGSSLGGYYAQYLGYRFSLPVVLINPALHPIPLLLGCVGEQTNYYTQEVYQLTEEAVYYLEHYVVDAVSMKNPVLVLLDKGDELIDYQIALKAYHHHGTVKCFEGGSHRFDHLHAAKDLLQAFYAGSK